MKNPWSSLIQTGNYTCAEIDKDLVDYLLCNQPTSNAIHFELLPEPFIGDPNAPVYLLNGNPGFGDKDAMFTGSPDYINAVKQNLVHNYKNDYGVNQILYNDNFEYDGITHPGCEWWQKRFKKLQHPENLFDVEFYPYHSESFVKQLHFPSFEYTKHLVEKAIKENKGILIRSSAILSWISMIPELVTYQNKFLMTNYSRTIYIPKPNECNGITGPLF